MSSDASSPTKHISLVAELIDAVNRTRDTQSPLDPVSPEELDQFRIFYDMASSALWDLFVTGYIEDSTTSSYDHYIIPMTDCHMAAFCSGEFTEEVTGNGDARYLNVCRGEWKQDNHKNVQTFFQDLDKIVVKFNLSGVVLEEHEDHFAIKMGHPFDVLNLIKKYLKEYDILTLDSIRPEDLKQKPKKISADAVKNLASTLRQAAQGNWGTEFHSVASDEFIDIRYFPVTASPTIDTADIALIEAQMVEEAVPFSLALLENTYRDCLGVPPQYHNGLNFLH